MRDSQLLARLGVLRTDASESPSGHVEFQERLATVVFDRSKMASSQEDAFYNPVMQFNRDVSVAAVDVFGKVYLDEQRARVRRTYAQRHGGALPSDAYVACRVPGLRVLEAFGATGLRSVRYMREVRSSIDHVVCNDLDAAVVDQVKVNVARNGLNPERDVLTSCGDATKVMFENSPQAHHKGVASRALAVWGRSVRDVEKEVNVDGGNGTEGSIVRPSLNADSVGPRQFDVIDLDPYGTAAPFLPYAVQSVANGGLLMVTCTDMAVLAGSNAGIAYGRYGSVPLPKPYRHEMALRLLLHDISKLAARYGRGIEPLLSLSIDYYVRVFVRVHESNAEGNDLGAVHGMVVQCGACQTHDVRQLLVPKVMETKRVRLQRSVKEIQDQKRRGNGEEKGEGAQGGRAVAAAANGDAVADTGGGWFRYRYYTRLPPK